MTCRFSEIEEHSWGYKLSKAKHHKWGYIEPVDYSIFHSGNGHKTIWYKTPANGFPVIELPKKFADCLRAYATLKMAQAPNLIIKH